MNTDQNIDDTLLPKEPSSFKLIFTLGLAGLISGIILVSMFNYTNPLIIANKEAAIQRAIFKVLPNCEKSIPLVSYEGKLIQKIKEENKKADPNKEELLIYAGYNTENELIGFAVPESEPGFQDIITSIIGYDAIQKKIIGFEVLESKETPGLGDKIFKDAAFQTNFKALDVEPQIVLVKNGEKKAAYEVEAITGATISSKAIVRSLNKSMDTWQELIETYVEDLEKDE